ncbi:MAG: hypothetical protein ACE5KS_07725, partial [Woeseiaceae bacterium]
ELVPLGEQSTSIRVLLLRNPQQSQTSLSDPLAGGLVPDRHMSATARSPRGELNQQYFLAAELRERNWLAVSDCRQRELGMSVSDSRDIGLGQSRQHDGQNSPAKRQSPSSASHDYFS